MPDLAFVFPCATRERTGLDDTPGELDLGSLVPRFTARRLVLVGVGPTGGALIEKSNQQRCEKAGGKQPWIEVAKDKLWSG